MKREVSRRRGTAKDERLTFREVVLFEDATCSTDPQPSINDDTASEAEEVDVGREPPAVVAERVRRQLSRLSKAHQERLTIPTCNLSSHDCLQ